jgi:gamma-butyrobetaine dioxygenase
MADRFAEPRDGYLRVHFAPGDARGAAHADFHWFWLRHWCDCCRHPATGERTLCASRVPLDLRPLSVAPSADGAAVEIEWPDAGGPHRSRYPLEWLRAHAYAPDRQEVPPPASDVARIEVAPGPDLARRCLEVVAGRGVCFVRGFGADTEALIDALAGAGLRVIGTHFGRIEDLRTDNTTNQNTDQLGYTDAPVDLHTDQPFLERPPRYQALHCMRPADAGGDNSLCDALQAARHLRSVDEPAYHTLVSTPVVFDRRQREFQRRLESPLLETRDGEVFRVRSSYFTLAPHRLPFADMEAFYRAYQRFVALTLDPAHQYRFGLGAGDFLLYDNWRMLHARTGFTGARWVRGVYFDPPVS